MEKRRTTPLKEHYLEAHHCTVDLRLEKLRMVPFFQELSAQELEEVNELFSASHFSKGQYIYYEGDKASFLRVVVDGNVKLLQKTDEGREVLIDMLQAGEYFGSLSAMGEDTYTETAVAQTSCCVLAMGLQDLKKVIDQYSSVAASLLEITSQRLNSTRNRVAQITTMPVERRIAHILQELAAKFGERKNFGLLIQLPLSRQEVADMTGTSAETASRIMSKLQDEQIITTGRQWVAITGQEKLDEYLKS